MEMADTRNQKVNALDISADEQVLCVGTNTTLTLLQFDQSSLIFQRKAAYSLNHNFIDSTLGKTINVKPVVDVKVEMLNEPFSFEDI